MSRASLAALPAAPGAAQGWPWSTESPPLPPTLPNGEPWPLVSIVVPSFGHGAFLEQALRSVLLQGYPRLELIVMDGGSTDGSVAVLRRYEPWLKHWVSQADQGPAAALKEGFAHAGGDILGVLNADDFLLPGCLATVAATFSANPEAEVVAGHGYFANARGDLGVAAFSDRWNFRRFCYGTCVLVQPATFIQRTAFERAGGFVSTGSLCWDMELWAAMARAGARFYSLDAFLAAFRLHPDSLTGRANLRKRRQADALAVMEQAAGRPMTGHNRLIRLVYRCLKFSEHPRRTLRQRWFFHATLKRWNL